MAKKSLAIPNPPALSSAPASGTAGDIYWDTTDLTHKGLVIGTVWQAMRERHYWPYSIAGPVSVVTGKSRIYAEGPTRLQSVRASVNTVPTGASLIVDVNLNGTTIFTTQSRRPTIAASGFTALNSGLIEVNTMALGDYLTVDVDQVGSTIAGSDLTVVILALGL